MLCIHLEEALQFTSTINGIKKKKHSNLILILIDGRVDISSELFSYTSFLYDEEFHKTADWRMSKSCPCFVNCDL